MLHHKQSLKNNSAVYQAYVALQITTEKAIQQGIRPVQHYKQLLKTNSAVYQAYAVLQTITEK